MPLVRMPHFIFNLEIIMLVIKKLETPIRMITAVNSNALEFGITLYQTNHFVAEDASFGSIGR